jgi:NAD dependent epimerase/dehydratase
MEMPKTQNLNLKNQKVLVTGAGGFIGSHLVESLIPLAGKVTAVIHYDSRPHWGNLEWLPAEILKEVEVVAGDITDPHWTAGVIHSQDTVFHLAALIAIPFSYTAPSVFFHTNVLGTLNILEACRTQEVQRLITASTSECYGTARFTPMDESHPLQAQSPYAASKIGADKAVESYFCSFGMPVVTVRPFNTFGPRQSARAIIPTILSNLFSSSENLVLGDVTPVRDFTYVQDTVNGFIAAAFAEGVEGETLNLGTGAGITIGELVEKIFALAGIRKEIECEQERVRPDRSEVLKLISDNSKARERLNWQPLFSLEEGLQRTMEFVKDHLPFYKTGRYIV